MRPGQLLLWITGALELLWGFPVLGGLLVINFLWTPLALMFVLHIITFVVCSREGLSRTGSTIGVVTSLIAWIPFVGMVMHLITGAVLLLTASRSTGRY
ncbi:hypothetical protein ACFQWB_11570 [Paenibacillus thermoaerophilus]|uniref:Uncharacterized protein n=1 Tax=Paenibacillus thermoaerophilus TaxID=1215385 RepID=A0ABW2V4W8_9BACL|nr:hypothetical protein [Paenibacillus thermoaerophilus]TMV11091.1 hypothetical protein FE781_13060 [Paenibacillus thermoaerophilus]